jgi:peptidyl-tRNA hydrolase, PTH2 family
MERNKGDEVKSYPVMYIFINKSLGMSPGKMTAQGAHAAVLASDGSNPKLKKEWLKYGFYTKLVMEARNAEHICTIERYLNDRKIKTFIVIDEGHTEIASHVVTALGCEIVDKNKLGPIFEEFKLYKPELTVTVKWNE